MIQQDDRKKTTVTTTRRAALAAALAALLALASKGCSGCGGDLAPTSDREDASSTSDGGRLGDGSAPPTDGNPIELPSSTDGASDDSNPPTAPGSLLLSVTTTLGADSRGNGYACVPVVSGGAGITATTITIQTYEHETPGTCVPVTMTRAQGGLVTGSYVVDCVVPIDARCLDQDETMSASGMPPGGYIVRVNGKIGESKCWISNDVVQVAAGTQTNHQVVLVNHQNPGCPRGP